MLNHQLLKAVMLKRPKQVYPMVEVIWDDAAGLRHGWMSTEEKLVPQLVLSVGFLIQETPDHIVIAMDVDAEGAHNGRSQIPRGMIRNIKQIRKAYGQKQKDNIPSVSDQLG